MAGGSQPTNIRVIHRRESCQPRPESSTLEGGAFEKHNGSLTGSIHISVGFRPLPDSTPRTVRPVDIRSSGAPRMPKSKIPETPATLLRKRNSLDPNRDCLSRSSQPPVRTRISLKRPLKPCEIWYLPGRTGR